ncbi:MAG: hypothetical protein HKL85_02300 [Acidimicrobiaceae bacterium]|nr:hypothetical protein [Acidimicrobiaceae bacterium]
MMRTTQLVRGRPRCAIVAVAIFTLPMVMWSHEAGGSSSTAVATLEAALTNASHAGWTHETSKITYKGAVVGLEEGDIGTNEGVQVTEVGGSGTVSIITFPSKGLAYVNSSALGLTKQLGFSSTLATRFANKWLLMKSNNSKFKTVVSGTTLASDFSLTVRFTGTLSEGAVSKLAGIPVRTITGAVPANLGLPAGAGQLYVSATGTLLPVALKEVRGNVTMLTTWTSWGHNPHTPIPTTTFPFPLA